VLGGAVCAAAYAFGPYALLTATQVHILVRPGLPIVVGLVWTFADRWSERERIETGATEGDGRTAPRLWPILMLLGVVIAWQGTVSFYSAAFCSVVLAATALVRVRSLRWGGLFRVAVAAGAGVVPVGLLALPYLSTRQRYGSYGWSLSGVADLSPKAGSFLSTDSQNVAWGELMGYETLGYGLRGALLFPGLVVFVLAVLGLLLALRSQEQRTRLVARLGVVLTLTGGLLALGASEDGWRQFSLFRILYELVPGWRSIRAPDRFWVVGILGLGVLAAHGACRVTSALEPTRGGPLLRRVVPAVVGATLVATMVAEGYRRTDLVPVSIQPVDTAIAELPEGGVVYLPVNPGRQLDISLFGQAEYVYRSTAHHRSVVNGKSSFFPPSYVEISNRIHSLPSPKARNCLLTHGIRYVVVSPRVNGTVWSQLRQPEKAAPLELIGRYDGDLLYGAPARRTLHARSARDQPQGRAHAHPESSSDHRGRRKRATVSLSNRRWSSA